MSSQNSYASAKLTHHTFYHISKTSYTNYCRLTSVTIVIEMHFADLYAIKQHYDMSQLFEYTFQNGSAKLDLPH